MKNNWLKLLCTILSISLLSACAAGTTAASAEPSSTPSSSPSAESVEVNASCTASNSWDSGSSHYTQYTLTITSVSTKEISDWTIHVKADNLSDDNHWNCSITKKDSLWDITPADYNHAIGAKASLSDIGIIVYGPTDAKMTIDTTDIQFKDGTTMSVSGDAPVQTIAPKITATPVHTSQTVPVNGNAAGALHVEGTHLMNSQNEAVQLKGVSTHGLAWYPQYVNEDAFQTLRDDWGANVVRLAMYTGESGGYCSDGNQEHLKQLIDTGVNAAADLGMYVIIDWHILSDGNPTQNQAQAESFFDEMSKKYASYTNVLYEICNEPQNSSWSSVIKPYAEDIIPIIRANSPDAIVIVGTNTWSQDIDAVSADPLSYDNVMYTLHFYAGTHKDNLRSKLSAALDAGTPVFVSECSICDASGNGGIDYDSAQAWLDLLNENGVSFIAWSLSNKAETSALISSSCDKLSGWSEDDLSETGKWFYQAIKQ
jgi:endoglucanase